jgi:hypothetical protein
MGTGIGEQVASVNLLSAIDEIRRLQVDHADQVLLVGLGASVGQLSA